MKTRDRQYYKRDLSWVFLPLAILFLIIAFLLLIGVFPGWEGYLFVTFAAVGLSLLFSILGIVFCDDLLRGFSILNTVLTGGEFFWALFIAVYALSFSFPSSSSYGEGWNTPSDFLSHSDPRYSWVVVGEKGNGPKENRLFDSDGLLRNALLDATYQSIEQLPQPLSAYENCSYHIPFNDSASLSVWENGYARIDICPDLSARAQYCFSLTIEEAHAIIETANLVADRALEAGGEATNQAVLLQYLA